MAQNSASRDHPSLRAEMQCPKCSSRFTYRRKRTFIPSANSSGFVEPKSERAFSSEISSRTISPQKAFLSALILAPPLSTTSLCCKSKSFLSESGFRLAPTTVRLPTWRPQFRGTLRLHSGLRAMGDFAVTQPHTTQINRRGIPAAGVSRNLRPS